MMLDDLRRRRAAARVKPGDGRALKRFRWWQILGRHIFYLRLPDDTVYAVDLRHGGDAEDGVVRANLYLNGRHHARSKVPAAFPVPGGRIEVAASMFGVKRAHYVTADGAEHQLTPDPASGEGRRARLDREHPGLSRIVGVVAVVLLVTGLGLNLLDLIEPISKIPPLAEAVGRTFESPLPIPLWLNIMLALAAGVGSMERALRLRYTWLDSAAN